MTEYDSTIDTEKHIERVACLLLLAIQKLTSRAARHDRSKLESPEKEIFDEYTPKLKGSTYGSDEYKEFLKGMGVALKHHYENNRHHPEHFTPLVAHLNIVDEISGMTLVDLIEMLCDWKAATERHENGDIIKSLEINQKRFGISPQLNEVFKNTAKELGWI